MKMCLITHQKFVRLDFQSVFPQTDDKIASASLCPDYLKHALLAVCMGKDSGHYAGCAVHSHQTRVRLEHVCVQIASDCGWRTPALGHCCQVCELRTANQVAFYTWQPSSRHCLTYRRIAFEDGASCWFRLRRSPRWVSVIDPVRINSSTAHTRSHTPQRSMLTKSEGHCLSSNTCTPRYPIGEARN